MKFWRYLVTALLLTTSQVEAKDFYVLRVPSYNPGFFSTFNTVIGALDYCEKNDIAGVRVDFADKGLYFDVTKGLNWWQYYFEPIYLGSDVGATIKEFSAETLSSFSHTAQFRMDRARANELIRRYVRPKAHVRKKINKFFDKHLKGAYVIGVHYRGTDGINESHPVTYKEVYDQLKVVVERNQFNFYKIFVATDEAGFLRYIKKKFPNKVIAIKAIRSLDGKPIHIHEQIENYKKGEDALIDCILLSRCNLLMKMSSNLSDCSTQFNPLIPVIRLNKNYFFE